MGTEVAKDLSHNNDVELGVGDIDLDRAEAVARNFRGSAFKVDVSNVEGLSGTVKGYDAVVNASWYEFNLHVMKACIKAGCHYNDLGGMFHMTRRQQELDGEAKKAGVTAIVGGGESPGITNVMSAFAAEGFSQVESVKVFAGTKEEREAHDEQIHFPFSVATVIDEYARDPVEFIDGRYSQVSAFSGEEVVEFPDPVGRNVCHYCLHSEPATLPTTIGRGVQSVEFKIGVSERMLNVLKPLIALGLTSEDTIRVNGTSISPKQFLVSFFNSKVSANTVEPKRYVALKAIVLGNRNSRKETVTCDLIAGPRDESRNATAYLTGIAGSVFGQFLASGKVSSSGVIAPEAAVQPEIFIHELERRNIIIRKSTLSS